MNDKVLTGGPSAVRGQGPIKGPSPTSWQACPGQVSWFLSAWPLWTSCHVAHKPSV